MTLDDVKAKALSLVHDNLVTLRVFATISAAHFGYSVGASLLLAKSFGLYKAALATLALAPKNLAAGYAVKRLFLS